MKMKKDSLVNFIVLAASVILVVFGFRSAMPSSASPARPDATSTDGVSSEATSTASDAIASSTASISPSDVRAIYLTAGTVSVPGNVSAAIRLIQTTRLNAVVINVKDGDGTYLGKGMQRVVDEFKKAGVYTIARVVVFQDNVMAKEHPELALHDTAGGLWSNNNRGAYWVDPASQKVWDANIAVAEGALKLGFREVNFDYIRFPSGSIQTAVYPVYDGMSPMTGIMDSFFQYLTSHIRKAYPQAVLSADLFAYSFVRNDGLGVGQLAGDAAKYFNVIDPMIYPALYTPGNFGIPNPAEEPYQVVYQTLEDGKKLLPATSTVIIRPWIQDFNMGATYDTQMVGAEMQAVRDAGYGDTWMAWNPANVYDPLKFPPLKTQ